MNKDDIRNRLFKITSGFRESKKEEPLPSLEQWEYKPEPQEKREHIRKDVPVYGIFETENSQFRALTKNISIGGVLVDSETYLPIYEHIDMTFIHRTLNAPVRTNGKVVRVDSDGVGIQFTKAVPVMSSL